MTINWSDYRNFKKWEFDCSYTAENKMRPDFLEVLQQIRNTFGKPMVVNSGYRHFTHPVERAKESPGTHFYGVAADISVSATDAMELIVIAHGYGIRRMGIGQKGADENKFVHIDIGDKELHFSPNLWSY